MTAEQTMRGALVRVLAWKVRVFRSLNGGSASSWAAAKLSALLRLAARRVWLADYVLTSFKWGHSSCVKSVAVIGDHVYTGCWDFLVKKWDARSGACLLSFVGHRQDIIGICAYGRHLFSCGDFVRMWDTETGEEVARFGQGTYYIAIANATHIFCARANGLIEIFAYAEPLDAAADGEPAAGVRATGRVVVSGAVTTPERELTGHLAGVMDFAMRGDMLISASIDHTARAWSISTGALLQTFTVRAALERERARQGPSV
jgi:WD40 repeat protein